MAALPHRWGVFEVADRDQRKALFGIGKLDSCLSSVARRQPWLRFYRAIQLSKAEARRRFFELAEEFLDEWDGEPLIGDFAPGVVPEDWEESRGSGRPLVVPNDLAVRWGGALLPLEEVQGTPNARSFRGKLPGGGESLMHLKKW